MPHLIQVAEITCELIRKNISHMYIRISRDSGNVRIIAPVLVKESAIVDAVASKLAWIRKKIAASGTITSDPLSEIWVWGQKMPLQFEIGPRQITLMPDRVLVRLSAFPELATWLPILAQWQKEQVHLASLPLLEKWQQKMGITEHIALKVRRLNRSWGNCRPIQHKVTLSSRLATKPPECLEYIIIHELAHMIIPDHSLAFKKLVNKHCPNWRELDQLLVAP